MDKYTYDDVLTEKDVRTGKVDRRIIGKLGWFSDDMNGCLCEAEEEVPRRLLDIVGTSSVPFVDEWHSSYQYFLLSKQHRMEEEKDDAKWLFGCDADGKIVQNDELKKITQKYRSPTPTKGNEGR